MRHYKSLLIIALAAFLGSCSLNSGKDFPSYNLIPVSSDGDIWGYINNKGAYVINPQFDEAGLFYDNVAKVKLQGGDYGFINEKGQLIIAADYTNATHFSNDLAFVVKEFECPKAITPKGKVVFELKAVESVYAFSEGLAKFIQKIDGDYRTGFVDKKGKVAIQPIYFSARSFCSGYCAVYDGNKWGYINTKGQLIIPFIYDDARDFHDGQAIVSQSGKYGVINEKNQYLINPQFSSMQYDGDLYLIESGERYISGWCDRNGTFKINPQFQMASLFAGADFAPVKLGRNYGYVDKKGLNVIPATFESAGSFLPNGLAPISDGQRYGFINEKGLITISYQFESIHYQLFDPNAIYEDYYSGSVSSDYVDLEALLQEINTTNPGDINLAKVTTFREVMDKHGLTSSRFRGGKAELLSKRLSPSLHYDLQVVGDPYTTESYYTTEYWGYYYIHEEKVRHTKQVFKDNKAISGVRYVIYHDGYNHQRSKRIADAIRQKYPDLSIEMDNSSVTVFLPSAKAAQKAK